MIGPGTLHRVIAACQRTFLRAGAVAVDPSPKHGKADVIAARARARFLYPMFVPHAESPDWFSAA